MFDFDKFLKDGTDKIFLYFNVETDDIWGSRFKKFIKWFSYKFAPAFLSLVSFILLVYIFNRIDNRYGIEKLIILVFVIIIFSLRNMNKELKKLTE